MGYLFLLKRLAHVCFCNRKFSESEKYFNIAADMTPSVTSNPANIFATRLNLLVLLTHTDLAKAKEYGERMQADMDDFLPVHSKDLHFMMGNIHFLSGDYKQAKSAYRQTLKMSPRPELEALVLNNLGFCSWMHLLDLPKLKKSLEDDSDAFEAAKNHILKEEAYTLGYFRQSIELSEKSSNADLDLAAFEELI